MVEDRASSKAPAGGRRFKVTDPALTFVRIDFQTRLQFGSSEVVIECPFRLVVGDTTHDLDPNDRAGAGTLLAIYPDDLERLEMSPRGVLTLTFASGASITVDPDDRFEAWSVDDFVCPPGGFTR